MSALRQLLAGSVDYAGLFPPAQLDMAAAVAEYAAHRAGPEHWMLARFVVPAARLVEFTLAAADQLPRPGAADPWRLSVLLGSDVAAEAALAMRFGDAHSGRASVDALELKAGTVDDIKRALAALPRELTAYVELSLEAELPPLLAALRTGGARAKIRTGGITPEAAPAPEAVAGFIAACHGAGVPFKATAGLHHPVRALQALTYAPDAPRGIQHGFLNVFGAAALVHAGVPRDEARALLAEERAQAFAFDAEGFTWNGHRVPAEALAATRRELAVSFGSCSLREPLHDLQALGLL